MGGKVPAEEMTPWRVRLLADGWAVLNGDKSIDKKQVIRDLLRAAEECPRTSCAYCEHIARSEAQRQAEVGEAEAG